MQIYKTQPCIPVLISNIAFFNIKPKWETLQKVLLALNPHWRTIFVISCVVAVSVDPLFFYLPFIDEKNKCLGMDKKLKMVTIVLRSVTDITFIVNIIYEICKAIKAVMKSRKDPKKRTEAQTRGKESAADRNAGRKSVWERYEILLFAKALALKLSWGSILIDFLAVLPIPQLLIVAAASRMRSSTYLNGKKIWNFFLLAQYLPRVYRLHHSSIELGTGIWIKVFFNFFLYILASHVLGSFWYFFSINRETSCWHHACVKHSAKLCNLFCDEDAASRNMTFINSLDEYCLVDVPENATTPFDFGIFLDSLKNGNAGSIKFSKKFLYSFWWGLRNLSNFGTNLVTSTYTLENCFAILISIVGLFLFLYLIGNVQTFISMETEKAEERRKILSLMEMDIQMWMDKYALDMETKNEIKQIVKKKSEKIKDADLENIFSILPTQNRKHLKRLLCMEILSKVPLSLKGVKAMEKKPAGQENKDNIQEKVLTSIYDFLKPVIYPDGKYVYRIGEPLDRMLIVTDGLIWTYNTTSIQRSASWDSSTTQDRRQGTGSTCLGKGSIYGNELLSWASDSHTSLDNLPMLQANAKAHGKVEGFILMSKDLKFVVNKYKNYWLFHDSKVERDVACQTIQKAARKLKQLPKKDQPTKLPQSDTSTVVNLSPASPVNVRQSEAALVLDIPSEGLTRASSQVP